MRGMGAGLAPTPELLARVAALPPVKDFPEIDLDRARLREDLEANPEVLAEAIQTVIRAEVVAGRSSIADPYAVLKELTRGHRVTLAEIREFVAGLDIGDAAKERLLALTPETYTGLAERLARE